ncbi:hypothetical protein ACIA8E_12875 [Streptomyces sp. NPDC051664]|uniref:hypothetical protein n=1 Tax=Streptomyces sp. NPDC051664 TaxID=3365668 RepID=UPI00379CF7EB
MRPGIYDLTVPAYGPAGYLRPLPTVPAAPGTDMVAPWTAGRTEAVARALAPLGVDAQGLGHSSRATSDRPALTPCGDRRGCSAHGTRASNVSA